MRNRLDQYSNSPNINIVYREGRGSRQFQGLIALVAVVAIAVAFAVGIWMSSSSSGSKPIPQESLAAAPETNASAAAIDGANTYVQNIGERDWQALWAAQTPRYHTKSSRAEMEKWWGQDVTAVRMWPGRQPTVAGTDSSYTWVLIPLEYVRVSDGQRIHQLVYWAFTRQGNQIDEGRKGCTTTTDSCEAAPLG